MTTRLKQKCICGGMMFPTENFFTWKCDECERRLFLQACSEEDIKKLNPDALNNNGD